MRPAVRYSLMLGLCVTLMAAVYQRVAATGHALPIRLSETGLYGPGVQGPGFTVQGPGSGVRAFSPQYPLWSDGAAKRRWVYLPAGTTIDVSDPDRWVFPDGTKFWKEFAINGRKVETRMLWKRNGDWTFATYAWNEAQTDATLVDDSGLTTAAEVGPDKRHRIPATTECQACHVSGRTEVLGFSALQLSPDRDLTALHAEPLSPSMVTLRTLLDEALISPARPEWISTPPRIAAADARTRTVLGYLSTNCGSCHNAASDIATLAFDLKALSAATTPCPASLSTTLDVPGRWEIPSAPAGTSRRITPGAPDLSAIIKRMRSRRPSTQMPPLGTEVVDHAAVGLLTQWIEADAATWHHRRSGCASRSQ